MLVVPRGTDRPGLSLRVGGGHFGLLYSDPVDYRISVEGQCDFLSRRLGV